MFAVEGPHFFATGDETPGGSDWARVVAAKARSEKIWLDMIERSLEMLSSRRRNKEQIDASKVFNPMPQHELQYDAPAPSAIPSRWHDASSNHRSADSGWAGEDPWFIAAMMETIRNSRGRNPKSRRASEGSSQCSCPAELSEKLTVTEPLHCIDDTSTSPPGHQEHGKHHLELTNGFRSVNVVFIDSDILAN
jgi:hypothetical protein